MTTTQIKCSSPATSTLSATRRHASSSTAAAPARPQWQPPHRKPSARPLSQAPTVAWSHRGRVRARTYPEKHYVLEERALLTARWWLSEVRSRSPWTTQSDHDLVLTLPEEREDGCAYPAPGLVPGDYPAACQMPRHRPILTARPRWALQAQAVRRREVEPPTARPDPRCYPIAPAGAGRRLGLVASAARPTTTLRLSDGPRGPQRRHNARRWPTTSAA